MKVAAIGFLGAVLGALISTIGTVHVSNLQLEKQESKEITLKQHMVMERLAHVLSYSGRINGLVQAHQIQIAAAQIVGNECMKQAAAGVKSKNCDMTQMNKEMNEFNKEIFDRTAEFRTQRSVAKFLFCERTNAMLNQAPYDGDWWLTTDAKMESLLNVMESELGCKSF